MNYKIGQMVVVRLTHKSILFDAFIVSRYSDLEDTDYLVYVFDPIPEIGWSRSRLHNHYYNAHHLNRAYSFNCELNLWWVAPGEILSAG